ncbi:ORF55 [Ranid herpesvirus 2]|uniref:ORF55 n=1 Tax=Ranid herpesvirus 2 TaxID=389214 RepID=Q14W51_9VIRU|nr:ORF55 [Ranid herpesvirus 2]ABG25655.1 ORF55 [Ranid herpesvirus 2]
MEEIFQTVPWYPGMSAWQEKEKDITTADRFIMNKMKKYLKLEDVQSGAKTMKKGTKKFKELLTKDEYVLFKAHKSEELCDAMNVCSDNHKRLRFISMCMQCCLWLKLEIAEKARGKKPHNLFHILTLLEAVDANDFTPVYRILTTLELNLKTYPDADLVLLYMCVLNEQIPIKELRQLRRDMKTIDSNIGVHAFGYINLLRQFIRLKLNTYTHHAMVCVNVVEKLPVVYEYVREDITIGNVWNAMCKLRLVDDKLTIVPSKNHYLTPNVVMNDLKDEFPHLLDQISCLKL